MAVQETYRPLVHEIFVKVNNQKTRPGKLAVLKKYDTPGIRHLLKWAFDPKIVAMMPKGDVPYIPNEAPEGTEHTRLEQQARTLKNFVGVKMDDNSIRPGNPALNQMKRELLFVQMLEGLCAGEAEVLLACKNKTITKKFKGLNASTAKEAFNWDDNFTQIQ